jgi:uncharacterized membrane protein
MKSRIVIFFVTTLSLSACNPGNPGGPGAGNPAAKQPSIGQAAETFSLSVPILGTSIKQGETKGASIGISRGKNFEENVSITFSELPKGLEIEPSSPTIKSGDAEAKLTLKASESASLGTFTIKVTGHPTKGADATTELKVTVDKK